MGHFDDIKFSDPGGEMHHVTVQLPPRQEIIAEAGALLIKDHAIHMKTVAGDGSPDNSSMMDMVMSAGKRVFAGEKAFVTKFGNSSYDKDRDVTFSVPFPGTILPLDLDDHGGEIIAQKGAFLFGTSGCQLKMYLQKKILSGLFSGEGWVLQRISGSGNRVFLHIGGQIVERILEVGETIQVETGSLAAMESTVRIEVREMKGISNMLFGGMGIFLSHLTGPGKIWIQTLPFPKLAAQVWNHIPDSEKKKFSKEVEKKVANNSKKGWF